VSFDLKYTAPAPELEFRNKEYFRQLVKGKASPEKVKVRNMVKNFVLRTCKWTKAKPLQFMSLPGPMWALEKDLFRETDGAAHFTALEHNLSFMYKGEDNVPLHAGRKQRGFRYLPDLKTTYYKTSAAAWLNTDFVEWCLMDETVPGGFLGAPMEAFYDPWQTWLDRYWSIDAYWLDFTSCLHTGLEEALERLPTLVGEDRGEDKPIVVSVLKGREQPETTARMSDLNMSREEYIGFLLDRRPGYSLEIRTTHEYPTLSNPMLNVFAVWKKHIQ